MFKKKHYKVQISNNIQQYQKNYYLNLSHNNIFRFFCASESACPHSNPRMVNKIIINNSKKKKIKRLSANRYYATAFISNPCDQLFGPPLDSCSDTVDQQHNQQKEISFNNSVDSSSITNTSISETNLEDSKSSENAKNSNCQLNDDQENDKVFIDLNTHEKFEYIPTPKWNKMQVCILEELFKKSRYPKSHELKVLSQRLNVMDTDVEVSNLGFYLI